MTRSLALRYALAPVCVALAVLLHLSPAGTFVHPTGLFLLCIVAAGWFGGAGPGFLAAALATFALPQLIAMSYPLLGGFFDLPRFITFAITGLAVGWGATRRRRAEAALRESEKKLEDKVAERTAALRDSEERYALAMQAAEDAHWDWNIATDEYFATADKFPMYGFPADFKFANREDFLARAPFHPEDRRKWNEAVKAHLAGTGDRLSMDLRLLMNGETRWVHISGLCVRDASGAPVRWIGTTRDVTDRKRMELAQRASDERYARAMEASNDGLWEWNPATDEIFVTARARELWVIAEGVPIRTRADLYVHGAFHAEDRPRIEQTIQAYLAGRTSGFDIEYRVIARTGEVRWIRSRAKAFSGAEGRPALVTGSVTDVTERKRAEEALRESEQRYERAMLASNAGLWEWDARKDEYYMSPRHLELLGFAPGTTFSGREDFLRRVPFHPEDLERWRQAQKQLFVSGDSYLVMDVRVIGKGEMRWVRVNALCFRDAAGTVLRWTGSVTDVTEARRAEEALRRSEQRYSLAMEASEEGHFDVDLDTDEHFISERLNEIHGFRPGMRTAKRSEFIKQVPFYGDDAEKYHAAIAAAEAKDGPERYECEFRIVRPSGEVRWLRTRGKVTRDAQGRARRRTGVVADVTARKLAEDDLRLSEERYARAMEGSNAGHWDWNVATDEIFLSARMKELFGFAADRQFATRSELTPAQPFHPEDRERVRDAFNAALSGSGSRFEIEYRIVPRPGEVRWVRSYSKVFRDEHGKPARVSGALNDITGQKEAEQALRLSEERYARAMEGSDAGHWDWNIVTDEMFVSDRAREMLALPDGPLPARRAELMALVPQHPDDRAAMDERVRSGIAAGSFEREYRVIPRPAEVRWLRSRAKVYKDAHGTVLRMTGSLTDITERKLAADALRASEERYRLALDASEEGHFDLDLDTGEIFTSERLNEVYGFPPGTRFANRDEYLAKVHLHGDDAEKYHAALAAAVAKDGPERYEFEFRIVRPSGEVRWLWTRGKVTRDAEGRARRRTGVVADVTERKLAADVLRESEARFRTLTELSSDWYWEQDEKLRFTYLSSQAKALTGYSGESSLGKTRWEIENMEPLSCSWAEHQAVLAARQPFRDLECRRIGPDGTVRYLSMSGAPVFDESGRFKGYQGIGRNITERKRAEDKVRESEARFRSLTELSSDWFWQQDENLRFVDYVPAEVGTRSGVAANASLGRTRWEFDNVTPLSCTWEEHKAVLAARLPFRDFEYLRLDEDGTPHYTVISGVPTFDAQGRFTGYQGVGRNVSERRRFEEELRQSEARFRALTELSSDWYWRQDEELRFTYVSPQVADTTNKYPQEWVIGKTRWELPGITPLSFTWAEHQAALTARQPFRDLEYARVGRDGRPEYVSVSGAPIFDERGKFKGYQGTGRNITERKRIEEELRARQEMLDLAQESARAVAFEWRLTADGPERSRWSAGLAAMHGVTPESYDGSLKQYKKLIHPEDWPRVKEAIQHAQRTGEVAAEYRVLYPDGSVHWLQAKGRMFFDAEGNPVRMVGFMEDVTQRRHADEELRSRQEMLELAQKVARAVAFEWRAEREERWPPELEAMYGLPPGSFPGSFRPFGLERQEWKKLVHPDDWAGMNAAIQHAYNTGDVAAEYRVIHADGSVHWLQSKGRMFFDAEKNPVRMIGLIQDVTALRHAEEELKAMERKLRQAQRLEAMGTLAGGIAHDFNNILGAILGYGEMAMRDAAKGTRMRRDLESIMTAGERGRALIDRVLAFSRSSVGERVAVHVEKVVREALDLISAKLPPNVTLHAKLHAGSAAMLGDATQVHQVLMNLATNAIQAMPAGGRLGVSLKAARSEAARVPTIGIVGTVEYIVLEVADTGSGIAPEILDRIFDPFFTTKDVGTGTGLGLSLVHGIVTELGGAIDVASTPGAGSMFTVYLPRAGDAADLNESHEPEMPRGDGQRVLVVDDEEPLVRLATRTLEDLGYVPTGFTSSAAALAAFRADPQRFDALLTDERMPGMSGSALIREIRGIRDRIPIVLMSGYVGGKVAGGAREAGAEEVLKKPLSARDLAASLARVLHS